MAKSYQGTWQAVIASLYTNSLDLEAAPANLAVSETITLTNGTGTGKAQAHASDQRTLSGSSSETLDLSAFTGPFGSVAFTLIKGFYLRFRSTTTGETLEIGAAASNVAALWHKDDSDITVVQANGLLLVMAPVDGWTIDSSNKNLKINNPNAGSINYEIALVGEGS